MAQKNKALDPMATPYNKIPPPSLTTTITYNKLPQYPSKTTGCYFIFPQISSYNVVYHQQPKPLIPLSLPPPFPTKNNKQKKKDSSSLTPVPWGPRIPSLRRRRRVQQQPRQQLKWVPKNTTPTPTDLGFEEIINIKRWKNRNVGYHQILPMETTTTSLMIKNIPNKYTRKLLIQTLDNHCQAENQNADKDFFSAYDFLYLPIDFNHRLNAGFAFVNFTDSKAASKFRNAFHGKRWDLLESPKVAEISRARIQGKNGLINNCKVMDFSSGSHEDMPVWFGPPRDGSGRVTSKMYTIGKFLRQPKILSGGGVGHLRLNMAGRQGVEIHHPIPHHVII